MLDSRRSALIAFGMRCGRVCSIDSPPLAFESEGWKAPARRRNPVRDTMDAGEMLRPFSASQAFRALRFTRAGEGLRCVGAQNPSRLPAMFLFGGREPGAPAWRMRRGGAERPIRSLHAVRFDTVRRLCRSLCVDAELFSQYMQYNEYYGRTT